MEASIVLGPPAVDGTGCSLLHVPFADQERGKHLLHGGSEHEEGTKAGRRRGGGIC